MPILFNIENDYHCQQELKHSGCECLFADLCDFWREPVKSTLKHLVDSGRPLTLQAMLPVIHSGDATTTKGWCLIHERRCQLCKTNIHVAGPLCQPWAPNGTRAGTADGRCMLPLGAWAATVLQLEHDALLLENSDLFPLCVMQSLLGSKYAVVDSMILSGTQFGWPGRRKRFFGLGLHLKIVVRTYSTMANTIPLFFRTVTMHYNSFLIADKDPELKAEFESRFDEMAGRKKSRASLEDLTVERARERSAKEGSWDIALTELEFDHWREYRDATPLCQGTFSLTQSAANNHAVSCTQGIMYSIIKNPSVHYYAPPPEGGIRRAWTASELALLQGFPILRRLASPFGSPRVCCTYAVTQVPLFGRSYRTVNSQIGNSQQVPVIGAVLLYVLVCVETSGLQLDDPDGPFLAFCRARVLRD